MEVLLSGGCLCGAVRYECTAEPVVAAHCQCRECQKDTGTGHSSHVGVPAEALRLTGELTYFETTAQSGNIATRGFCPTCGSPIVFKTTGYREAVFLTAGSLDDPTLFRPTLVVFAASAQPWDLVDPDLPQFPAMPD